MLRKMSLALLVTAIAGIAANAADLPARGQLGVIFAEPDEPPPTVVYRTAEYTAPIIPYNQLPNPPWNRGNYNYGSSWSFYYPGPYYGGPYYGDGARLPYVCGLYGYC
jgi:hypothetical protein